MITEAEFNTVIAALRYWQRHWDIDAPEMAIATDAGLALSQAEIDALIERVNT
jgi:hypothetical protein